MDTEAKVIENIKNTKAASDLPTSGTVAIEPMFITTTAADWLKQAEGLPPLKPYCSELFNEGDVCIVYGEPNGGKSIFCVELAQDIANGESKEPFRNENPPQPVIYFDFELNVRQFFARYADVSFSSNFYRGELNPNFEPSNFEQEIIEQIEHQTKDVGAKVVIIDNLTWLLNETEKGTEAGKLMKLLQKMKNRLNISLMVVAHTPKRSNSEPLTLSDIAGSSRLGNFTTSAIAIGKSIKDEHLRYIKCTKTRNSAVEHGAENVAVFQISRNDMLCMDWLGYDTERNHLLETPEKKRLEEIERVKELCAKGLTQRQIADMLQCSLGKINNIIKKNK